MCINGVKLLMLLSCLSWLAGCAANSGPDASADNLAKQEKVLIAAKNSAALIDFYQKQLREKDSVTFREKLAKAYLDNHDPESALFTLEPLLGQKRVSEQTQLIAGSAYLDSGQLPAAEKLLKNAFQQAPENGEIANLLGILYARTGDYVQSRQMFIRARRYFYDDVAVKNNLALLDILEGRYQQAIDRLTSLSEKARQDPQLRANLLLAMAKSGQIEYLRENLDNTLTKQQIQMIFQALNQARLIHQTTEHQSDQPVSDGEHAHEKKQ